MIRLASVLLLMAMPFQFAYFYRDYFGEYQRRSAYWFDPIDLRDVAEYVILSDASGAVPAVYLSQDLDDGGARWRFYVVKHHREDLWQRTGRLAADGFDLSRVAPGSLLVLYANDSRLTEWLGAGGCSVAKTIINVAGGESAVILRKGG